MTSDDVGALFLARVGELSSRDLVFGIHNDCFTASQKSIALRTLKDREESHMLSESRTIGQPLPLHDSKDVVSPAALDSRSPRSNTTDEKQSSSGDTTRDCLLPSKKPKLAPALLLPFAPSLFAAIPSPCMDSIRCADVWVQDVIKAHGIEPAYSSCTSDHDSGSSRSSASTHSPPSHPLSSNVHGNRPTSRDILVPLAQIHPREAL